ncbi:MAG: hypothetical protein FWD49_06050 [Firmicutes bacterium]|nr:hypothetical protein [Bacillota bacterium]
MIKGAVARFAVPILILAFALLGLVLVPFNGATVFAESEILPYDSPKLTVRYFNYLTVSGQILRWLEYEVIFTADNETENENINKALISVRKFYTDKGFSASQSGKKVSVQTENYGSTTKQHAQLGSDGFTPRTSNAEVKKGFLFNESTVVSLIPFASQSFLKQNFVAEATDTLFNSLGIESADYVYTYGTKYKNVTSNADLVSKNNASGMHLHEYRVAGNFSEREVSLTFKNPNTLNWYLLSAGTAVLIAIAVAVSTILKSKRKR